MGGFVMEIITLEEGQLIFESVDLFKNFITRKYKFDELSNFFSWHIDMNEFYQVDGNITNYWLD